MRFHVFYTDNYEEGFIKDHKACSKKQNIETVYHPNSLRNFDDIYKGHGDFMTSMMDEETEDVVGFLDLDCLVHNGRLLANLYDWANENNSFIGNAQCVSHGIANHHYPAPSTLLVSKKAWMKLGKPSFTWFYDENGVQFDTAQRLALEADKIKMSYGLLYPLGYDGPTVWHMQGFGNFGTGTLYPASWHHFQISQYNNNASTDLWSRRVHAILNDEEIIPNHLPGE